MKRRPSAEGRGLRRPRQSNEQRLLEGQFRDRKREQTLLQGLHLSACPRPLKEWSYQPTSQHGSSTSAPLLGGWCAGSKGNPYSWRPAHGKQPAEPHLDSAWGKCADLCISQHLKVETRLAASRQIVPWDEPPPRAAELKAVQNDLTLPLHPYLHPLPSPPLLPPPTFHWLPREPPVRGLSLTHQH